MSGSSTHDAQVGTQFSHTIAIIGIVAGFIAIIALGAIALYNYNGWKKGRDKYPIVAWLVGWLAIIAVTGVLTTLLIGGPSLVDKTGGTGTLIMAVGAPLATYWTWLYDRAHASHRTLKTG